MIKIKTNGITLVELLVAVAIVVILSAGLYIAGDYAETQAKIKQTQSTIEMLSAALEQYYDANSNCFPFKAGLTYNQTKLEGADSNGLNIKVTDKNKVQLTAANYNNLYASSEALYYFLNRIPASRKIIGSINSSLITNKDDQKREYFYYFNTDLVQTLYPLLHFVDAWGTPFRYTYSKTAGNNFPLIESAGPDRDFGDTIPAKKNDDITSR
jgi:prepilin-type N-terminal cleavage/methylation domain-containing protein